MVNQSPRGEASKSPGSADRKLVIVSGAGRSGTSTVAGSLNYLGYVVPPPELKANAANPRGYFEPTWAINFHKRLLRRASIHTMDARPWALDLVAEAARKGPFQTQLTEWLEQAFDSDNHLVVKDPRAFWARGLWLEAARASGADTSFVTMLRHPAEVIGSRDLHYASGKPEQERITALVRSLAGWINATLTNEVTSREHRRAFLLYGDLLADWRSAMSQVDDALDLHLPRDEMVAGKHRIDDFIDPGLHRVKVTWDDLQLPVEMQEIARAVWDLLAQGGASSLTVDPELHQPLDQLAATYRSRFNEAVALATDEINTRTRKARQEARRQVTRELREEYGLESGTGPSAAPQQRGVRGAALNMRRSRARDRLPDRVAHFGRRSLATLRGWATRG